MKKYIVIAIALFGRGIVLGVTPTQQTQISTLIDHIEVSKPTTEKRVEILTSLYTLLQIAYDKSSEKTRPILYFAKNEMQRRISNHTNQNSQTPYPETINTRVQRHNSVRENPLTPHPQLMQSAQLWAEHLAKNNIRTNVHRRIQGNYVYTDIQQRFENLGITFAPKGKTTFSENVAYNTVKCTTQDCDQELKQATKRSREFFYDREKPYNGAHYRSIVQENFNYIGVGIAIHNGRYHIVIHYGTDIIDPIQISKL